MKSEEIRNVPKVYPFCVAKVGAHRPIGVKWAVIYASVGRLSGIHGIYFPHNTWTSEERSEFFEWTPIWCSLGAHLTSNGRSLVHLLHALRISMGGPIMKWAPIWKVQGIFWTSNGHPWVVWKFYNKISKFCIFVLFPEREYLKCDKYI